MVRHHLQRIAESPDGTLGTLLGLATLEEEDRGNAAGESRIPAGTYLCRRTVFHRGNYGTWEVTGVPGRSRILFHIGNTEEDTEGCILLGLRHDFLVVQDEETGERRSKPAVVSSRVAFDRFMARLREVSEFELVIADVGEFPQGDDPTVELAESPIRPPNLEKVEMPAFVRYPITASTKGLAFRDPEELAREIEAALRSYYRRIADIRTARLSDIWRLARDLVLAIETGADAFGTVPGAIGTIPGPRRMEIAVEVVWRFIEEVGGVRAVRDLVGRGLDQVLPRAVATTIARWAVTEKVARGLVRVILEFAVREMKERID